MIILLFLTKLIISSGLIFGYYFLFLRNKQFHSYNRYYLLSGAAISLVIPWIHIPVIRQGGGDVGNFIQTLQVITANDWETGLLSTAKDGGFRQIMTFQNIAVVVYFAGFLLLLSVFLRSLFYIRRLTRSHQKTAMHDVDLYLTGEPGTPFSFFHSIFWNEKIVLDSLQGRQILEHELFHIRAGHSYDTIFMNLLAIIWWFNPFFHFYLKEVKAVHEFLADEHASKHTDKYDYAELLVTEAISHKKAFLTNQFFHNQIKRRITMIITNNPVKCSSLRRLLALPVAFIIFCAFTLRSGAYLEGEMTRPMIPLTVVIDAGHGGIDAGVQGTDGIYEKDLTLSIAKRISRLSSNYGVKVVMTRDEDILPGNAVNAIDGLKNRVSISEKSKADLFVSIHVNQKSAGDQSPDNKGFDIYVSGQNKQFEKSKLLGSAISGEIRKSYDIMNNLKESDAIWVLKSNAIPAVLIECGYLNEKTDAAFITNEKNQENLARHILQGIVNYSQDNK